MGERTRALRDEHRRLRDRLEPARQVAQQLPSLDLAERRAAVTRVVRFLRREVVPHARIDERVLVQELLFGLLALIEVHTWKEDERLLGALESPSWPALATRPGPVAPKGKEA